MALGRARLFVSRFRGLAMDPSTFLSPGRARFLVFDPSAFVPPARALRAQPQIGVSGWRAIPVSGSM